MNRSISGVFESEGVVHALSSVFDADDEPLVENRIHEFRGNAWEVVASWTGSPATAIGGSSRCVLVGGIDGELWAIDSGRVSLLAETSKPINAIFPKNASEVIVAGNFGFLATYDIDRGKLLRARLEDHAIPKPGRDIFAVSRGTNGPLLCGRNQLLLRWASEGLTQLFPCGPTNGMRAFHSVSEAEGDVYVSLTDGLTPAVAKVTGDELEYLGLSLEDGLVPFLATVNDQLVVLHSSVCFLRQGVAYRNEPFPAGDNAIFVNRQGNLVLAIGSSGSTLLIRSSAEAGPPIL